MSRRGRAVPVVEHLGSQHRVQDEPGHEAIQDERVIHLLQGSVDTAQASKKVIEDRKGRQLTRPTLAEDGEDLRDLASNAECARSRLQAGHLAGTDKCIRDYERVDGTAHRGEERARLRRLVRVHQNQDTDDHVLDGDQASLAVRAEREPVAHIVRQRDHEAGRFQQIARE